MTAHEVLYSKNIASISVVTDSPKKTKIDFCNCEFIEKMYDNKISLKLLEVIDDKSAP